MKRLLLTGIASFAILFAQAQCQANFQYTSSGLNLNLISTSINAGSTLNSQTPTWNFGDGSPQVTGLSSITHTYQNAGVYNVCIEIFTWPTSWTTCSSIHCDSILVGNVIAPSWDCNNGICSDPGTGNGTYASLSACNAACVITPSWDCNNGICSDPGNGMGSFIDSLQCIINCSSTHITDFDNFNAGKVIKIVDVLGRKSKGLRNQPLFYIYDDGTVEKKIIIE